MNRLRLAITDNTPFWVLTITAIALLVGGFLCPPLAVIDGSVLKGIGELIGLGAMWDVAIALRKGTDATITHGDTTIQINADDDESNPS